MICFGCDWEESDEATLNSIKDEGFQQNSLIWSISINILFVKERNSVFWLFPWIYIHRSVKDMKLDSKWKSRKILLAFLPFFHSAITFSTHIRRNGCIQTKIVQDQFEVPEFDSKDSNNCQSRFHRWPHSLAGWSPGDLSLRWRSSFSETAWNMTWTANW